VALGTGVIEGSSEVVMKDGTKVCWASEVSIELGYINFRGWEIGLTLTCEFSEPVIEK
jgi:hypothetical protein